MSGLRGNAWGLGLVAAAFAGPAFCVESQVYESAEHCLLDGELDATRCANAAANARAEYEERVPRFASREACARAFAETGCAENSRAEGFFSPRQTGFRVEIKSWREQWVRPVVSGPPIRFEPRSILRRDLYVHPHYARLWTGPEEAAPRPQRAVLPAEGRPVSPRVMETSPSHPPPRAPADENFDCASLLEPSERAHADISCYPARTRANKGAAGGR